MDQDQATATPDKTESEQQPESTGGNKGAKKTPNVRTLEKQMNEFVGSTNERLDSMEESQGEIANQLAQVTQGMSNMHELLKGLNANMQPVRDAGHAEPMEMDSTGDGDEMGILTASEEAEMRILEPGKDIDVNDPGFNEKMARLAFDKEILEIYIHDTSEEQADRVFTVMVNGRAWFFLRDSNAECPRYVVEVLALARPSTYENVEKMVDGVQQFTYRAQSGLRYPFSIVNDPNPRGKDWIKGLLAQRT